MLLDVEAWIMQSMQFFYRISCCLLLSTLWNSILLLVKYFCWFWLVSPDSYRIYPVNPKYLDTCPLTLFVLIFEESIFCQCASKLLDEWQNCRLMRPYSAASDQGLHGLLRPFCPITKTCLYNIDPLKPHFYIVKLGFTGVYIIFLISAQNIDCGYLLELPRRGGSNEYPQSMFWAEIWKISEFFIW